MGGDCIHRWRLRFQPGPPLGIGTCCCCCWLLTKLCRFQLADRLIGIYKTDNATKTVTINPTLVAGAATCLSCFTRAVAQARCAA